MAHLMELSVAQAT